MTINELQTRVETVAQNASIRKEKNFEERAAAIDFIEFPVTACIDELLLAAPQQGKLLLLKQRAEQVKAGLEEIDNSLFEKLRENIRMGRYTGKELKKLVKQYVSFNLADDKHQQEPGYDNLDLFVNGLFPLQTMPGQTKDLEPEMVYYQKTPARVVFELAEKTGFTGDDVFFDLGSGLGQGAMLVNLLTGVAAKGVEFEPAFCACATDCAATLNLPNVEFINTDARLTDYSAGTVFFMFTPFRGALLQEVLELLRQRSLQRKIKLITYGPCTAQVALQSWLHSDISTADEVYRLTVFES
jgi:hypothetical protein